MASLTTVNIMIINIKFDCEELTKLPLPQVNSLFTHLLFASTQGHHRLVLQRAMCTWLISNANLGDAFNAHLVELREEFTQYGGLVEQARTRLDIIIGDQPPLRSNNGDWSIGHQTLLNSSYLSPSHLLVEDADSDGNFFAFILDREAKKRNISKINFIIENGGGSGTYKALSRLAQRKVISVCICDNDKLTPHSSPSDTYRLVMQTAKDLNLFGGVFATICREAENLIPFEIILDLPGYNSIKDIISISSLLDKQDSEDDQPLWFYFDIKDGAQGHKFSEKCKTNQEKVWLSKRYCVDTDKIEEIYYPGFGKDVVQNLLRNNRSMSEMAKFIRTPFWDKHFSDWFEDIIWFLASRPKSRYFEV